MVKAISILGSTGSIGRQTAQAAGRLGIPVLALAARRDVDRLEEQARQFHPKYISIMDPTAAKELRGRLSDTDIEIGEGEESLVAAATVEGTDCVVTGISGSVGLRPTLAAIHQKRRIALANKETLVCAGEIVMAEAARCGAEKVSLYCLEGYDEMPMGEEDRSECERDGVAVYAGWGPREVSVEGGKAAGVSFVKCLKVRDENGRFAPVYDENTVQVAPCTTVLFCIGQKAEWRELLSGTAVEFDPNGTAKADPVTYQTAEADIFVGGDAFTGQKFAIDAIAAGKQGAVSLHRFVQGATLTIGRDRRQFIELDKKSALIAVDSYDNTPRQRVGYNEALRNTFRDERVAFTAQQVRAETARCLGCGASIVDPNKCIGCGVCTTKCAFDAIHLHRERPECSTMYACEDKMKAILPYMIKRSIKIKKAERRAKKAK